MVTSETSEEFDAMPPKKKPKMRKKKKEKAHSGMEKKTSCNLCGQTDLQNLEAFEGRSDSDFAAYLLSLEMKQIERWAFYAVILW